MSRTSPNRRFYGRRHGRRLNASRLDALEFGLPKFSIELPQDDYLDLSSLRHSCESRTLNNINKGPGFRQDDDMPLWLEIGFGNGEHLAQCALQNPDIFMIGCEPFINGVSALLKQIDEHKIETIRIWPDDARLLMDSLPDHCLDRVFLIHPDPWPKTRHHRRRFIQDETLNDLARLMKPGAELRLATDDPDLADWMLWHCWKHPAFTWAARTSEDWQTRPKDWPATRYGEKAIEGAPVYLIFTRI